MNDHFHQPGQTPCTISRPVILACILLDMRMRETHNGHYNHTLGEGSYSSSPEPVIRYTDVSSVDYTSKSVEGNEVQPFTISNAQHGNNYSSDETYRASGKSRRTRSTCRGITRRWLDQILQFSELLQCESEFEQPGLARGSSRSGKRL
jgi:hypothetical protein